MASPSNVNSDSEMEHDPDVECQVLSPSNSGSSAAPASPPPTPELDIMTTHTQKTGGRGKCETWRYFEYYDSSNTSKCKVPIKNKHGKTVPCGRVVKSGKVTKNLDNHLEKHHVDLFIQVKKIKEADVKRKKTGKQKDTLVDIRTKLGITATYPKDHPKQLDFSKKCARFFGTTSAAYVLVETEAFHELIHCLDPKISVPGRTGLSTTIMWIEQRMTINLMEDLASAHRINVSVDIWSKKRLVESFLGITASFYSRNSRKRQSVALGLIPFPHPHDAEAILKVFLSTLKKWRFPSPKLAAYFVTMDLTY